jgi:hypothetical protein
MARSSKKTKPEIELRSDGWERFKTAVSAAAKSGPKHRQMKKPAQSRKRRGRHGASASGS